MVFLQNQSILLFQKEIYLKGGEIFSISFEAIIYLPKCKYLFNLNKYITLTCCSLYIYKKSFKEGC